MEINYHKDWVDYQESISTQQEELKDIIFKAAILILSLCLMTTIIMILIALK